MPETVISAEQLLGYADLILQSFEFLNTLSGTGFEVHTNAAQPVWAWTIERDKFNKFAVLSRDGSDLKPDKTVAGELGMFLEDWQNLEPHSSRLIVAPFGYGKSGEIVRFAKTLAVEMKHNLTGTKDPANTRLKIPLPVRLREINRFVEEKKPRNYDDWLDFLHHSQAVWATASLGRLNREQIAELFESSSGSGRRLICLYDGVDELAYGVNGPQKLLNLIARSHAHRAGYVIASREPVSGFSPDQILRLKPLSDSAVAKSIESALVKGSPRHAAATAKFTQLQPAVAELIRRPLFLASWIDAAMTSSKSDYSDLPANVTKLMERVTLNCFDRAIQTHQNICPATPKEQRKLFLDLGWALFADAEAQFDGQWRDEVELLKLLETRINPAHNPETSSFLEQRELAHALGFLESRGDGTFIALKIPVVEFLVGNFLATLASGDNSRQREFIEIVRHWCYRPQVYDTLDFTWRIVGYNPSNETRQLVDGLIKWMASASQHEYWRAKALKITIDPPVPDCLVRPAAVYALRISDRTQATDIEQTLIAAVNSAATSRAFRCDFENFSPDLACKVFTICLAQFRVALNEYRQLWLGTIRQLARRVPESSAATIMQMMINSYVGTAEVEKKNWAISTWLVAERTSATAAETCLTKLIEAYDFFRQEDVFFWSCAVEGVCLKIPDARIEAVIRQLVDVIRKQELNFILRAVQKMALRIPRSAAQSIVIFLLENSPDHRSKCSDLWELAIANAASRIPEEKSELFESQLMQGLREAEYWQKHKWEKAFDGALRQLINADPESAVRRLLDVLYRIENSTLSIHWKSLIDRITSRWPEAEANRVLRIFLQEYTDRLPYEWFCIICGIMGRASATAADEILDLLWKRYKALEDEHRKYGWFETIMAISTRVSRGRIDSAISQILTERLGMPDERRPSMEMDINGLVDLLPEEAVGILISKLLDLYDNAEEQTRINFVRSIEYASRRLPESNAGSIVSQLVNSYLDKPLEDSLVRALESSCGRVREDDAEPLLNRLVNIYPFVRDEDKAAWSSAIQNLAARIAREWAETALFQLAGTYENVREEDIKSWSYAIEAVASRIPPAAATSAIALLTAENSGPLREFKFPQVLRTIKATLENVTDPKVMAEILDMVSKRCFPAVSVGIELDYVALFAPIDCEATVDEFDIPKYSYNVSHLKAMNRADPLVVLDRHFSVVPPVMTRFGFSKPLSSLELKILTAFGKVFARHLKTDGIEEWSSWTGLADKGSDGVPFIEGRTHVNGGERARAFDRLLDEKLIVKHSRKSTYKITTDGLLMLESLGKPK